MGAQTTYNEKDAEEIIGRLSKGEPMAQICRDDWLPCERTVRTWINTFPEFAAAIASAREDGFDAIALECLEIADETSRDTRKGPNGDETCNSEWISRSRLRVETRLKLLAKWDPKRYGERQTVEHTDPSGGNPFASLMEAVAANGRPRPQTGD